MFYTVARYLQLALDIVLPRKERVVRLDSYTLEDIPVAPEEHEKRGVQITTLMDYRTQAVSDLVKALKYDRAGIASQLLALSLAEYLREEVENLRTFSTREIVVVPIPLHPVRLRERGFNQIEKVLLNLPNEFKDGTMARIDSHILTRTRDTEHQTRLTKNQRLSNVKDAFALQNGSDSLPHAHFLLIDDVTTTGATLSEAAKPFKGHPVTLLALAHA